MFVDEISCGGYRVYRYAYDVSENRQIEGLTQDHDQHRQGSGIPEQGSGPGAGRGGDAAGEPAVPVDAPGGAGDEGPGICAAAPGWGFGGGFQRAGDVSPASAGGTLMASKSEFRVYHQGEESPHKWISRHKTEEAAGKSAMRLARLHRGQGFTVFKSRVHLATYLVRRGEIG